jgi:drug/metabolite transporter (DMT)-like permease
MFGKGMKDTSDISFSLLIVLATSLYGINVNLAKKYLNDVGSLKAASVALSLSAIPALIVLIFTGYFHIFTRPETLIGTLAASTLGVMGTAIATILFYMLIKRAGVLFTSMVTYGIPFVAIGWGFVYNENIGWKQIVSLFIILAGVYIANRNGKTVAVAD